VEPSDSIDNVKQKVQDRIAVNPDSQFLYFGSTLLPEGSTLSDYNVGKGSTLPLVATAAFSSTPLPNRAWSFGVRDVFGRGGHEWMDLVVVIEPTGLFFQFTPGSRTALRTRPPRLLSHR